MNDANLNNFSSFHTLESFIAKEEHLHPHSRGSFSDLLRRIGLACKIIESNVRRAGLREILGRNGKINVQGEKQMNLDVIANHIMKGALEWMPAIAGISSEEEENVLFRPPHMVDDDAYCISFDPLDGSSNIEANVAVGTIFSIHRRASNSGNCEDSDFLQPGYKQVAAGYVVYGSSTIFVYTTGNGVHGFTLDPEVGEFILSHRNIRIPDQCRCFSANESKYETWDEPTQKFADFIRTGKSKRYQKTTSRYIGSMVSDFHRNLLYGGVFMYPADQKTDKSKLRLQYECAPLAFIAEQAGGAATTGKTRIMDIIPNELHQRVPVVIGNKEEVELYEKMVFEYYQSIVRKN
jgi:fructose-1,6-bisphosphatase I